MTSLEQGISKTAISPHFRAIRRTGRISLVVLALAAIMIIGAGAVGGFGITIIIEAIRDGKTGLTRLCPA